MTRNDFELMAPVGSYESLHAAINAGTDAVYFGVEGLNMRSGSAANFNLDDLRNIVAIASEAGVKTYLTVNTIIYDDEMTRLDEILRAAALAKVSAVIASDMAAIIRARSHGLEVHISTQLNLSNVEAVNFYSQWADTVVLARELSLSQVSLIHQAILSRPILGPKGEPVKIEMFCHGALCMAVSGKCYMSLHEMNRSANRGTCGQICRRGYRVTDLETGDQLEIDNKYIMSPKDLKTLSFLDKMAHAGVRVFKIEGRARGAEYVTTVVTAYDRALRAIADGSFSPEWAEEQSRELAKVFNRGFWDGYYLGRRLGEWSSKYGSSATRIKQYVARGVRHFPKIGVAEFKMEAGELCQGDEAIIIGPTTGAVTITIGEIRVDNLPVAKAVKGDAFSISVPCKVRPSDKLYRWDPTLPSRPNQSDKSST
ncbi:MAG: U32 family peptidase [Pseudoflavonifractor sp.]|nr:U32 family peptidase [Alloprevotella sp.]MCM1116389.1 U32 family peptidase [Pseudoflavonifractor sp.]